MPQLIVRQIEEKVVTKLKAQAGQHGVSMEEEHRRILRQALLGKTAGQLSFKEALLAMPNVVVSPHMGTATRETRMAMAMLTAENLLAALAGQRPPNLVNPEVWR